jgi:hypothetical protein
MDEKTFESTNSGAEEWCQFGCIARDHATPESNIDVALTRCALDLGAETVDCCGRRDAVEWHINNGGDATCRGRAGCRSEALPFGTTRFVDVNMSVNEAGHDYEIAGIDLFAAVREVVIIGDGGDQSVLNVDCGWPGRLGRDDPRACDCQMVHKLGVERV